MSASIVFFRATFSNSCCFCQLPCLYLSALSIPRGSSSPSRKEQVKQMTFMLKISFSYHSEVLRTNLKTHLKSLALGREHIHRISFTNWIFFSVFLSFCYSWPFKIEITSTHHVLEKAVCCSSHKALIRVNRRYMTNPWCAPLQKKNLVANMDFVWKVFSV